MKKLLTIAQLFLFVGFNFFLFLSIIQYTNSSSTFDRYNHSVPVYNGKEEYDPSLSFLNSVSRLEDYCDSIFELNGESVNSASFQEKYPAIASAVVRKRFYHGYSSYSYSNNFMALMLEPFTGKWVSAIVIPDDIMKYPYAACSQQSIVTMELLKRKGFSTRKVGFDGGKQYGGHFSFEVFYNGSWHFFDPNQEPDAKLLASYNRPGIEYIAKNENLLLNAYRHWDNPGKVKGMLTHFSYGTPNRFEAPNALIYQNITKFLSNTLWLFFLLAFIYVRRKCHQLTPTYNVRNRRVFIPAITGKGSVSYN